MNRLKIVTTLLAILMTACAPQATPTINSLDVQNTAMAGAFTLVAQTQAAIPTATPLPPTEAPTQTPLPTNTPLATVTLSTSAATSVVLASTSTPGGDHCQTRVLSWSPKGRPATIHIINTTRAAITVSLYLSETADHFECGYRVYEIGSRSDVFITDMVQGCYTLWAFNNDQRTPVNAFGSGCINNPDKWTIEISQDKVKGL